MKFISTLIDRLFVFIFGLAFMQFPHFMQQYQIRLSGHIEELKLQVDNMKRVAAYSGHTVDQFIQKFISSPDLDFSQQGQLMLEMVHRLNALNFGYSSLQRISAWLKPFQFIRHLNSSIGSETLRSFEPGLVFSLETVCYALIGMWIGFLVFRSLVKLFGLFRKGSERAQGQRA